MIIDTHSHLNFKAYDDDRDEVIKRTKEAGVVCIDVGTKYETSQNAIELAEKNEGIYAAIGMHPIHIKTDLMKLRVDEEEGGFAPLGEDYDKEKYRELAKSKKVVAIGEVGLDYYYKPKGTTKKEAFKQKQKEVFIKQVELAEELNLPMIIHCRMAYEDVLEILALRHSSEQAKYKVRGVVHCFSSDWQIAKRFIELGFLIGINGIIFSAGGGPASGWKLELEEAVKQCPLDKILTETDCPYLTPPQSGAERNEPIFVKHVIQKIADLKGLSFEGVADKTFINAKELFGI